MDALFNCQRARDFWPENRGDLSNEQEDLSVEGQPPAFQHVLGWGMGVPVTFIERFVHSFIFGLCLINPCPCFQWHA